MEDGSGHRYRPTVDPQGIRETRGLDLREGLLLGFGVAASHELPDAPSGLRFTPKWGQENAV